MSIYYHLVLFTGYLFIRREPNAVLIMIGGPCGRLLFICFGEFSSFITVTFLDDYIQISRLFIKIGRLSLEKRRLL